MRSWPPKPFIYEINTWVWLTSLSREYNLQITLATVPESALDALAELGIDAVWLMGVWQRSPAGRDSALNYAHEYLPVLPDLTQEDIIGSAYAIGAYEVDARLGGRDEMAAFRQRLQARGLKLITDFVPNHVSTDHAWIMQNPTCFVRANAREYKHHRSMFFETKDAWGRPLYIAHGRDPYFPSWIDTAQLNAFSADYRKAALDTLTDIAGQCDGVRCDMAMLMLNSVFANTWGAYLEETIPETDFWDEIIPQVKGQFPGFLFMAESYWGLESTLIQQGFDFAYDKTLYDRVTGGDIRGIHAHLLAPLAYQKHTVRFIENHDEPRAAMMGFDRSAAAAALVCTLPGAVLLHDGQLTGRRVKLPVQIKRQPDEPVSTALEAFYRKLLNETRSEIYQHGNWWLFEVTEAWEGNNTHEYLLAHGWRSGENDYRLIVVNLSDEWAQGMVNLHVWRMITHDDWCLHDTLQDTYYFRTGESMTADGEGLFVELSPHIGQIFRFERIQEQHAAESPCKPT